MARIAVRPGTRIGVCPSGWSVPTKVSLGRPALCPVEAEEAILRLASRFQLRPGALILQLGPD